MCSQPACARGHCGRTQRVRACIPPGGVDNIDAAAARGCIASARICVGTRVGTMPAHSCADAVLTHGLSEEDICVVERCRSNARSSQSMRMPCALLPSRAASARGRFWVRRVSNVVMQRGDTRHCHPLPVLVGVGALVQHEGVL